MFLGNNFSEDVNEMISDYRDENSEWIEENPDKSLELMMLGFAAGADNIRREMENVQDLADESVQQAKEEIE